MSIFETVITILLAILCLLTFFLVIGLIISWSKAKEKVFVTNWANYISVVFPILIFLFNKGSLYGWLLLIIGILMIPYQLTCLSPEGVRLPIFIKGGIDPVENYSYEYTKNGFGHEVLLLCNKNGKSGLPYNIGIKKPKTVKMLADWYGKHDYKNPMLPDDINNEGE